MTDALTHTPSQTTKSVWVFTLDVPENQLKPWEHEAFPEDEDARTIWPLRDALGLEQLDNDFTEVFPVSNIREYGLARYLTEANGYDDDSIAPDSAVLESLTGPVALVHSQALGNQLVTLRPEPPLKFVGRYDARPDPRMPAPIISPGAAGNLAQGAPVDPRGRMPVWPLLLFIGLIVTLVSVLWVAK